MREAQLAVEDISVTFGSGRGAVRALDHVSLTFQSKHLTLVIGPSGSGKTTLLSVLGCLLTPDSGVVYIAGSIIADLSEEDKCKIRRQSIGYVFQAFRLFRSLSALENVLVPLEISGCRGSLPKKKAQRALERVGLADKLRLKPDELSGGEKQRVAIARALINDPPIILADEPTASLDSVASGQIAELLHKLAKEDERLVVVVSHDPRWLAFGQRSVVLQDGQVVEDRSL